jgi:hypothetical protein
MAIDPGVLRAHLIMLQQAVTSLILKHDVLRQDSSALIHLQAAVLEDLIALHTETQALWTLLDS